ncbi:MAG TPA: hypothetical protein DEA22_01730 [Blastocatellia bacterium]|nr:hypothetical protein [Blastocatellia bacterium]
MVERLTVIFFILLCLFLGTYLILAPWDLLFGNWGENYLLVFVSDRSGLPMLQRAVSSNWFRGAITGLGVLNLVIGFWEAANFSQSVALLRGLESEGKR